VRIISRQKAIYFFLTLGVCLAALAFAVGSGWIILNWRAGIQRNVFPSVAPSC
jgi:hypothetical protein